MTSQDIFVGIDFIILFSSSCENTVAELNPVSVGNLFFPKFQRNYYLALLMKV